MGAVRKFNWGAANAAAIPQTSIPGAAPPKFDNKNQIFRELHLNF